MTIDNLSLARQIKITVCIIIDIFFFSHLTRTPLLLLLAASLSLRRSRRECVVVLIIFAAVIYERFFGCVFLLLLLLRIVVGAPCVSTYLPFNTLNWKQSTKLRVRLMRTMALVKPWELYLLQRNKTWELYRSWEGIEHACVCIHTQLQSQHSMCPTLHIYFFSSFSYVFSNSLLSSLSRGDSNSVATGNTQ